MAKIPLKIDGDLKLALKVLNILKVRTRVKVSYDRPNLQGVEMPKLEHDKPATKQLPGKS